MYDKIEKICLLLTNKHLKFILMKKSIIFSLVLFSFISATSQTKSEFPYFKDDVFYTKIENGIGEQIPAKFSISSETIIKIKSTKIYQNWEKDTYTNPENVGYVKKHKSMKHIEVFLMGETMMSSKYTQMKMKNQTSYSFVKGGSGHIFVGDNDKINISFPCQSQNGYGNIIISTAYYSIIWNEEKNDQEHDIYISE